MPAVAGTGGWRIEDGALRSIEARLTLGDGDPNDVLCASALGGLAWIVYRMLVGDPKWEAEATMEALRRIVREVG
ncbi:hypothetical protein [Candidatus Nitrospira bockiana]